jgi:hypothetical protein
MSMQLGAHKLLGAPSEAGMRNTLTERIGICKTPPV